MSTEGPTMWGRGWKHLGRLSYLVVLSDGGRGAGHGKEMHKLPNI
jgi:hypothetical protein